MTRLRLSVPILGLILLGLLVTSTLFCGRDGDLEHAFSDIDRGLSDARKQIERINAERLKDIRMEAEAYRNLRNERYAGHAVRLDELAREYSLFLDSIKTLLLEANTDNGGQSHKYWYCLETALPGDRLLFHDIAVRVPGDKAERTVGAMVFRVE